MGHPRADNGLRSDTFPCVATTTFPAGQRTAARTTVALKLLMAVTGLFFVLFVLAHMYGNLMIFGGAKGFNTYAHHLRTMGMPTLPYRGMLTVLEVLLVLALIGHAYAAFTLWSRASHARTTRYAVKKAAGSTLSSRTMRWGGLALLLFVVFHLLQFTFLAIDVGGDFATPYARVVAGFQVWWDTLIYVLAMIALAMHLRHGVYSASQTLGWTSSARARQRANAAGIALATVIAVGFLVPPLAVLFRLVK